LKVLDGLTLSGGAGQINLSGTGAMLASGGASQTLDNLTISGTNANGGEVLVGDPTGPGGASSTLTLGSHAVLQGNLTVQNGSAGGTGTLINYGTIQSGGSILGALSFSLSSLTNNGSMSASSGAFIGGITINSLASQSNSFTNNGRMTCDGSGTGINLNAETSTNNDSISASNGGDLQIGRTWTNSRGATISAVGGSVLDLKGTFTNLGTISADSSTVYIESRNMTLASMGVMNVTNSDVYFLGSLALGSNETYTPGSGGTFNLDGGYNQGQSGTITGGTLALNGATFHTTHSVGDGNTAKLDGVRVTGGDVNVDGGAEILELSNNVTIDSQHLNLTGWGASVILDTSDGSTDHLDNLVVSANQNNAINIGGNTGATVESNSTINGCVGFGALVSSATFINNGTINGQPYASDNAVGINTASFVNNGAINIANGASLSLNSNTQFVNHGIISLSGNDSVTAPNGLNVGDGTLMGNGVINGDLTLSSDPSTLEFALGGTSPLSGYDAISVDGNITLGGNLDIVFKNGFQTSVTSSETFIVLNNLYYKGGFTGEFLNVSDGGRLMTTDGYGSFQVNYGSGPYANEVVLSDFQAVPEPASFALLAMGSFLLGTRRHPAARGRS